MDSHKELARETLETTLIYLGKLREGIEKYLFPPEAGSVVDRGEKLILIMEGLDWVVNVLDLTKKIQRKPISMQETTSILRQLLEAMEDEDDTLLNDLLADEILPLLKNWQENISCDLRPES